MSHETPLEEFWNVPPGQREHMPEPAAVLMKPCLHGLQAEAPLSEAVPGGHCMHEDEKARENEPAGQVMHSDEPDKGA